MEVQVSLGISEGVSEELIRSAIYLVMDKNGITGGEISIALLGDQEIRDLNRIYLGQDRTTDVIAFALYEEGESVLGDIYIGYQQAIYQAGEMDIPLIEEIVRLVIHGTLHVLGHDHPDADANFNSEMFQLQEEFLHELLDEAS